MEIADVFLLSQESLLALLTGIFALLALWLLVKGFLQGKNKPHLWAWVVRAAICVVAFCSQFSQGATYSLALALAQTISCLCIIGLVLYTKSNRGKLDRVDWAAMAIAGSGVVLWIVSGNPLYSIFGVMLADSCATAMSIRASLKNGSRESIPFWTCALLSAGMAVLSAKNATWTILIAPLFSCVNASVNILSAMFIQKRRHAQQPAQDLAPAPLS